MTLKDAELVEAARRLGIANNGDEFAELAAAAKRLEIAKTEDDLERLVASVTHDPVANPSHYRGNGIEAIDVVLAFNLPWHLGNAWKYIARWNRKGDPVENLEKARWLLDHYIACIKAGKVEV